MAGDTAPPLPRTRSEVWRGRLELLRVLPATSWALTLVALGTAIIGGILGPMFTVMSGLVAGAIPAALRHGASSPEAHHVYVLLIIATCIYVATLVMGPLRETVGDVLMRRVDEHLMLRVMAAIAGPRGVAHLEDPAVLDQISQSLGAVTAITPGMAAYYLVQLWAQRLQATFSLLIVARYSLPWAGVLLAGHLVAFRFRRWHWNEMTMVLHGRTNLLRRSHYLRELAVDAAASKETRVFGLSSWLVDRYRRTALDTLEPIWRGRQNGAPLAVGVTAVLFGVEGLLLLNIVHSGVAGHMGLGAVVVYTQAVVAASNLGQFTDAHVYVQEGMAALTVLRNLESSVPTAGAELPGADPAGDRPQRSLHFEDVTFRYQGQDHDVFRGLDLEIEAGKSLAVVGENGAGKTTLVKLLCRLYDPTGGRITADGVDLRTMDAAHWQRRVAAIFQDYVQYKVSAHDNVAFGWLGALDDRDGVIAAADRAGAMSAIDALPNGWDTVLSREFSGGADLSGGEWQRLALARALFAVANGAPVLILDEPTASLDVRGEAEIYDRFLDMTRGVTTIVISHRFSTVRRADRIVVLEEGRVVEDGTHHTLMAAGGRYAEMYQLQASRFEPAGDAGG